MPRQRVNPPPDEGPPGPGAWIVTFSDCATLLLCFFVLLLTFSSFEEDVLRKLSGVFKAKPAGATVDSGEDETGDSLVEPAPRRIDRTEAGSEKPTVNAKLNNVKHPRRPAPAPNDTEAYRDRRVLYFASSHLFWGKGSILTQDGRAMLDKIAKMMQLVPCRLSVAESSTHTSHGDSVRLERCWAVVDYLTSKELTAERLSIANARPMCPELGDDRDIVAISLLARDLLN